MIPNTVPIDTIFIHVTKACNLVCAYCYFSASRSLPDELTTTEFASLWGQIISISPKKVVFTGGEPLLRLDIFELLQDLRHADEGHRIIRCLNTNGHLVTSEVAERLVGLVDEVRVSVDALSDRNDELRGKGNFANATRAIDLLCMVGLEPKVLVTVTRRTLADLEKLLCLLISQGITQININRFRPVGRGSQRFDWCVSEREVASAVEQAWHRLHPTDSSFSKKTEVGFQRNCGVGAFLNILPNGDVFPCHVLSLPEFWCGNLRSDDLSTICARHSLLARLAALDFDHLKHIDSELIALTVKGVCMGEVYAQMKASPAWNVALGFNTPTCSQMDPCRLRGDD